MLHDDQYEVKRARFRNEAGSFFAPLIHKYREGAWWTKCDLRAIAYLSKCSIQACSSLFPKGRGLVGLRLRASFLPARPGCAETHPLPKRAPPALFTLDGPRVRAGRAQRPAALTHLTPLSSIPTCHHRPLHGPLTAEPRFPSDASAG